jgi:uncharacterized membrane-anchored protein
MRPPRASLDEKIHHFYLSRYLCVTTLGFGTIGSSAVLMSILIVLIYWSIRNDRQPVMASHKTRERR